MGACGEVGKGVSDVDSFTDQLIDLDKSSAREGRSKVTGVTGDLNYAEGKPAETKQSHVVSTRILGAEYLQQVKTLSGRNIIPVRQVASNDSSGEGSSGGPTTSEDGQLIYDG